MNLKDCATIELIEELDRRKLENELSEEKREWLEKNKYIRFGIYYVDISSDKERRGKRNFAYSHKFMVENKLKKIVTTNKVGD